MRCAALSLLPSHEVQRFLTVAFQRVLPLQSSMLTLVGVLLLLLGAVCALALVTVPDSAGYLTFVPTVVGVLLLYSSSVHS